MSVYSYLFAVLVACVSYLVYQRYGNLYPSIISKAEKRYDYIIAFLGLTVGAGTTGCVLAARLSEDPGVKVLLVEAGQHMGYFTKIPLTATASQQGPDDWAVRTAPQKYSSFGLWDQSQMIPRGKGLGGSGQINFLLHGFGMPEDYDRWSSRGFKYWGLEDLKPYFIKAFGTDRSEFNSDNGCSDGYCPGSKVPMKVQLIDDQNELLQIFQKASASLSDKHTLLRKAAATIKEGVRFSSFDAYLKTALNRRNLHVVLRTQAISVRFDNNTASSLFILRNNRELDNVFANKEIILCAGAIKTPQILILSGIGPRNVLQRLKIKTIVENEEVGRNLHDHMNMPIYVSIKKPISVTLPKVFTFGTVWDYFMNGEGLLSFPPVAGVEYHNDSALMLFSMGTTSERLLRDLSNYKHTVFRSTFPFHSDSSKEGFMFLATCVQPRSRGSVTLSDISSALPPVIDPHYLKEGADVRCMIRAIRRAERLVASAPFQEIGARIHWPRPERCLSLWNYSREDQLGPDRKRRRKVKLPNQVPKQKKLKELKPEKQKRPPDEFLECVLREVAVTGHHVGGTAAGGTVVDDELRVKSVSGLRIVDASVLPTPLSLYPNSVLIAMAEKAADLIKRSF